MSLLDKITLKDISDTDLRATVEYFIKEGSVTERGIVSAALALEINAEGDEQPVAAANRAPKSSPSGGAGNGGGGKKAAAKRTRASDASRVLQGKFLAAIRRVPKTRRKEYSPALLGSREKAIAAINKAYPAA